MPDPRNELQGSFQPQRRFQNYGDLIVGMQIQGFRNHVDTKLSFESPVIALCGINGTGKSTALQLAAAAYQAQEGGSRYYVSSFILAGRLDEKPFSDNASVELMYAQPLSTQGQPTTRTLSISRSGSSWRGYDNQPVRSVIYLGTAFHLAHVDRDDPGKKAYMDCFVEVRTELAADVLDAISKILICKYERAHENQIRKRWARKKVPILTAKRRNGSEYSEANMGSGEARLYALVMRIEAAPAKSLILIEEPETALHPSAQFELGTYLVEVAKRKGIQIILTTHSEYLLLALPQKSRIYLKREGNTVVPIPGIGVKQAISLMDNCEVPSLYILVEDDVAEAVVVELLRTHDIDLLKTVRVLVAGDRERIGSMMQVFEDQKLPVCAVRDGDCGENQRQRLFKLFGDRPPEKEVFASESFRRALTDASIDVDALDIANVGQNHHRWFDPLEAMMTRKRSEVLSFAASAYLQGIPGTDRKALVDQIKTAIP